MPGTFHAAAAAAAAAATPTVLSPTAGMTTFPIHGTVTQPAAVFSPNALQPFAGSHCRLRDLVVNSGGVFSFISPV